MAKNPPERHCPVCGELVKKDFICSRCRARPVEVKHKVRPAWRWVGLGAILLLAMGVWSFRINQPGSIASSPDDPLKSSTSNRTGSVFTPPVPDGPLVPGENIWIPFGDEYCTPWNVSAAVPTSDVDPSVLFVTSKVIDPSGLLLAGFSDYCGILNIAVLESLGPGDLKQSVRKHKPKSLVAVGLSAVHRAIQEAPRLPLFFAKIKNPVQAGLARKGLSGITSVVPISVSLAHLFRVLPDDPPISILAPPGRKQRIMGQFPLHEKKKNRDILWFDIPKEGEPKSLLQLIAAKSKTWIVVADPTIVKERQLLGLLVFARENQIAIGFTSEEWVKKGALAGVGADTYRIGQQLCTLTKAYGLGKIPPGKHVFCPEYSFSVIHQSVNEQLGNVVKLKNMGQSKLYKWH